MTIDDYKYLQAGDKIVGPDKKTYTVKAVDFDRILVTHESSIAGPLGLPSTVKLETSLPMTFVLQKCKTCLSIAQMHHRLSSFRIEVEEDSKPDRQLKVGYRQIATTGCTDYSFPCMSLDELVKLRDYIDGYLRAQEAAEHMHGYKPANT